MRIYNEKYDLNFDNRSIVLHEFKLSEINAEHKSIQNSFSHGYTIKSSALRARDAYISGYLIAKDKEDMRVKKQLLLEIINPLHEVTIEKNGKIIQGKPVSSPKFSSDYQTNTDTLQKFNFVIELPNPFFRKKNKTQIYIATWIPDFSFPYALKSKGNIFGHKSESKIVEIFNDGAVATGALFEITSKTAVPNPYLKNLTTGKSIKVNTMLASGETLRINTNAYAQNLTKLSNGREINVFHSLDDVLDNFLQLNKGVNLIRYGCESLAEEAFMEVSITFEPLYMEAL